MDVVCTSGPGTGKAADQTKIQKIKAGLGNVRNIPVNNNII
jgi:hypothetical protein